VSSVADAPLEGLKLSGPLRPYQQRALDAFEADRAAGRTSTHIVAPPGSGKTVIGLEIVRRLGRPALVLAPTATIQAQWGEKLALFTDDPPAVLGPAGPLNVLTYQAICQTGDPDGTLRDAAAERLVAERARTTAATPDEVRAEVAAYTGAARERHDRDVNAEIARLKREVARGEHLDASLDALVAPAARERLEALKRAGVGTLVLDECHHLASMWGYLVRVLVASLPDVHVVGLTATSPADLRGDEAELYRELLGPVDFEISTPAVVRDRHLAPYQELAFFTTPLASERAWLAERHVRFDELVDRLHDPAVPDEEDLAFGPWVIGRMRYRDTGDGEARVPFSTLAAKRPDLARAGLRYLGSAGLELPDDAPRGEGWREAPTLDDWLVLIGDYAVGCLRPQAGEAADRRLSELQVGLRDLGFVLTRQGVRRGGSDVDRVLMQSAAKPIGAIEILAAEAETRGDDVRAVVLCDTENPPARPEGSALALTGGARGVLRAFGDDARTAVMRPLLVTGQGVACLPADADVLAAALGATERSERVGIVSLSAPGWDSRAWVRAAGRALAVGTTQLIVGTRGLLGEGWDAPTLNVLVDLTSVAADVAVRQMRGRTLRLDPADETKIASNWDVVCVAADLARGTADYDRFVRRHAHLRAPCEDGSIESGVSHVHPILSPFHPPPDEAQATLNGAGLQRAADHLEAWSRWRIGEPYVGEDVPVVLVRSARPRRSSADGGADRGGPEELGALLLASGDADDAPLPSAAGPLAAFRTRALAAAYPDVLPLPRVARAVVAAYVALGEIRPTAGASLAIAPRPGGLVRCALTAGDAAENGRFAGALEEALSPALGQRWVIGRPTWPAGRRPRTVVWRALTFRAPLDVAWHPVPSDLGSHKERAAAYAEAWHAHVGAGELLFAGREGAAGRAGLTASASASAQYLTSRRELWH
jgi:superfamily II DNA or RNA helicase